MYRQSRGEHYRRPARISMKQTQKFLMELRMMREGAELAGDTAQVALLTKSIQQHEANLREAGK